MEGWAKTDTLPDFKRKKISPERAEANKIIQEFIESKDKYWKKSYDGWSAGLSDPVNTQIIKDVASIRNEINFLRIPIKVSKRQDSIYLIKVD